MILLDTNIISEMMKVSPSSNVLSWINEQDVDQLYVSTVTIAEISYGINVLPMGKRKITLETAFHSLMQTAFDHRVLGFDEPSSYLYGKIMSDHKKQGKSLSILDGQIAAISMTHNASLATRNVKDFQYLPLILINPFDYVALT